MHIARINLDILKSTGYCRFDLVHWSTNLKLRTISDNIEVAIVIAEIISKYLHQMNIAKTIF